MDRPGVHKVPKGSGEKRKMKETGCEVIYGVPMTPAVKELVKVKVLLWWLIFRKTKLQVYCPDIAVTSKTGTGPGNWCKQEHFSLANATYSFC